MVAEGGPGDNGAVRKGQARKGIGTTREREREREREVAALVEAERRNVIGRARFVYLFARARGGERGGERRRSFMQIDNSVTRGGARLPGSASTLVKFPGRPLGLSAIPRKFLYAAVTRHARIHRAYGWSVLYD